MNRAACNATVRAARCAVLAAVILSSPWPGGFQAAVNAALSQKTAPPAASSPTLDTGAITVVGIGAVITMGDQGPEIKEIVPGGPAAFDGRLKVGDQVKAVAQGDGSFVECSTFSVDKVVDMIRGKKGTTVRLQVAEAGVTDPALRKTIGLIRQEIRVPTAGVQGTGGKELFTPQEEAKLTEFEAKVVDAGRKLMTDSMKTTVDDVVRVTRLDDAGRKSLEAAAAAAVDRSAKQSAQDVDVLFRKQFKLIPAAQRTLVFQQMDSQAENYAKFSETRGQNWPTDQPAWKEGLKKTLTVSQAAAWDASQNAKDEAIDKEIGPYLQNIRLIATNEEKRILDPKLAAVQGALALPKDRVDKLDALENSLIQTFSDESVASARKGLLGMGETERKNAFAHPGNYAWDASSPGIDWDQELAKVLTADELKLLQGFQQVRKNRWASAMGDILIALMDQKVALTADQRRQLETIAGTLVEKQSGLMTIPEPGNYFSYNYGQFYTAAAEAGHNQLKTILDPTQMRRWQEAAGSAGDNSSTGQSTPSPAPDEPAAGSAADPEYVEVVISDYIEGKSEAVRKSVFQDDLVKAEDVARVAHLPQDAAARLETAARGAAEEDMEKWNQQVEQMVRSQLGDVNSANVKMQLGTLQNYVIGENYLPGFNGNKSSAILDNAIKSELNSTQAAAWKKETDARNDYHEKAVTQLILAGFDQRIGITQDQRNRLEPMMEKVIHDYSPDFRRMFMSQGTDWFLQSYTMYFPVAGIEEKDLKALLTKDQCDRWFQSSDYSNAISYWGNIQMWHQQRMQMVKNTN